MMEYLYCENFKILCKFSNNKRCCKMNKNYFNQYYASIDRERFNEIKKNNIYGNMFQQGFVKCYKSDPNWMAMDWLSQAPVEFQIEIKHSCCLLGL